MNDGVWFVLYLKLWDIELSAIIICFLNDFPGFLGVSILVNIVLDIWTAHSSVKIFFSVCHS